MVAVLILVLAMEEEWEAEMISSANGNERTFKIPFVITTK